MGKSMLYMFLLGELLNCCCGFIACGEFLCVCVGKGLFSFHKVSLMFLLDFDRRHSHLPL